ncbi:MAG: hypothetical protein CMB80_34790 [Flammeovirgaceae bacterium]|nr:hypothetical protein [Flammeovirgaceae bacterium]
MTTINKIHYSYQERGMTKHGTREILFDFNAPEEYSKAGRDMPLLRAVAFSGFPPIDWCKVLDMDEKTLYEGNHFISYSDWKKKIQEVIAKRRQASIELDSI